jgi:Flp pilus assembly protein TadG
MRKLIVFAVLAAALAAITATSVAARPRATNGKIVTNSDNLTTGEEQVYTVDPDGTDQLLVSNNSEVGQWSPEGSRIALFTDLGERLFNRTTCTPTWRSSAACGRRMARASPARASATPTRA